MWDSTLSEGARRALDAALEVARSRGAAAIEPLHLLRGLLAEESQASELLLRLGINPRDLFRFPPLAELGVPVSAERQSEACGNSLPCNEEVRGVLAKARHLAAQRPGPQSIETHDLLLALGAVESAASRTLAACGADWPTLSKALPDTASTIPLQADVRIEWRQSDPLDQTRTLRILDAAANRAREGLRVVEDFARFVLDDRHLTARLKGCRHALREALSGVLPIDLLRTRETRTDVGTTITTPAERVRLAPTDVAQAAFKRVQEAVRSLEEFGKLRSSLWGEKLEALRYELYTLEKSLLLTDWNRNDLAACHVCLLVSESQCHHGSGPAVKGALAAGVGMIQVREKDFPERQLLEHARRVRIWTQEAGARLIVNDRPEVAVLAEADGVHLGQEDLSVKDARAIVGSRRLVGVSTHTIEQARQAVLDGADYLGVGPVFPSQTKKFDALAGLDFVRQAAQEISLPWFAIGGITGENIDAVREAGASRVAVGYAITGSADPFAAARRLVSRLATGKRTETAAERLQ